MRDNQLVAAGQYQGAEAGPKMTNLHLIQAIPITALMPLAALSQCLFLGVLSQLM